MIQSHIYFYITWGSYSLLLLIFILNEEDIKTSIYRFSVVIFIGWVNEVTFVSWKLYWTNKVPRVTVNYVYCLQITPHSICDQIYRIQYDNPAILKWAIGKQVLRMNLV